MEYIELGPTPSSESCQHLGPTYDAIKAKKERQVYIDQLERQFEKERETGIVFRSKSFPHDFGTYWEVCVFYNENDEEMTNAAFHVENNSPEFWDDQAKTKI